MASVNYAKCKSRSEAKAIIRHCDKDERMKHEHSNNEIDKTKCSGNVQMKRSYAETCRRLDDRIAELDGTTNTNRRKDRVEVFMLETAVPQGLTDKQKVAWVRRFRDVVADMYGEENILNVYYHVDEVHEYRDENGERAISREHVHLPIVPVDSKGSLNGKWFSSARNMRKLNETLQAMTQQEFGVDYMDGSKRKSKKTVEQLKNESAVREAVEKGTREAVEALMPSLREEARVTAEKALKSEREALQRDRDELAKEREAIRDFGRVAKLHVVGKQVGRTKSGEPIYVAGPTVEQKQAELMQRDRKLQQESPATVKPKDRQFGD